MISTPWAMRCRSLWTAATTFLSSFTIISMMSGTGILSTERLLGLMASVGRDSHFEWVGMSERPVYGKRSAAVATCNRLHYSSGSRVSNEP